MIFGHPIELPPNEPLWSYTPMPEPMEPEPTTHTVATNDLPQKWREIEGPVAEAKQWFEDAGPLTKVRLWLIEKLMPSTGEPPLDPYAIGYGDGLLQAADELEAALAAAREALEGDAANGA